MVSLHSKLSGSGIGIEGFRFKPWPWSLCCVLRHSHSASLCTCKLSRYGRGWGLHTYSLQGSTNVLSGYQEQEDFPAMQATFLAHLSKIPKCKLDFRFVFVALVQLTPNNSNLQGKAKKFKVIGSLKCT